MGGRKQAKKEREVDTKTGGKEKVDSTICAKESQTGLTSPTVTTLRPNEGSFETRGSKPPRRTVAAMKGDKQAWLATCGKREPAVATGVVILTVYCRYE
jgi:hypothetical protein